LARRCRRKYIHKVILFSKKTQRIQGYSIITHLARRYRRKYIHKVILFSKKRNVYRVIQLLHIWLEDIGVNTFIKLFSVKNATYTGLFNCYNICVEDTDLNTFIK